MKLKNRIFYADRTITAVVLLLTFMSGIMIYSTWSISTVVFGDNSAFGIFGKQLMFTILAISFYFVTMRIPYKSWKKLVTPLYIIMIFLLVIVFSFEPINDSHSWIPLPGFNFQPSEFSKIVLIMYMAKHYDYLIRKEVRMDYIEWIIKPLFVVSIPLALIIIQPDPGTALIIISFLAVMFFATGYKLRNIIKALFKFAPLFIVLAFVFVIANVATSGAVIGGMKNNQARMISRFDFKDPCDDIDGSGFQICNSLIAINSGGLTGKGLGNSTQKYLYLPESHTDAIIAVTAEEWGFVGTMIILILYGVLIYKILFFAKKASTPFGYLICVGISFMFLVHISVNILGILNVIPFTGVPLPFYSYGGTFLILCFGSLGIVQSIAIEHNRGEI